MAAKTSRVCKECQVEYPVESFIGGGGEFNPRAKTCIHCYVKSAEEYHAQPIPWIEESQRAIVEHYLLQLKHGDAWLNFPIPGSYYRMLRPMMKNCLYCGVKWGPQIDSARKRIFMIEPQIEHMDPISRGGADTPANIAFACASCNSAKGSMPYSLWLTKIPPNRQGPMRAYYIKRHQRPPEEFVPGVPVKYRNILPPAFLEIPEDSRYAPLNKMFILMDVPEEKKAEVEQKIARNKLLYQELLNEALDNLKPYPWMA